MRVRKNKNKKSSVLASGGVVGSGKNESIRRRYILIGAGLLILFVLGGLFFFVSNREGEAESACSAESSNALYKKAIPLFSYERGITPKDSAALHEIAQSIQAIDGYQQYVNCVYIVSLDALHSSSKIGEGDLDFVEKQADNLEKNRPEQVDKALDEIIAPEDLLTLLRSRRDLYESKMMEGFLHQPGGQND